MCKKEKKYIRKMAEIRHMTFDYIIFSTRNTGDLIPFALSGRQINIKAECLQQSAVR